MQMNYCCLKANFLTGHGHEQQKAGKKGEGWDGVRNYQASNNMKNESWELWIFYHSVTEKEY